MSNKEVLKSPVVALTMGDPAGVGPEIVAGAWTEIVSAGRVEVSETAYALPTTRPIVFGDPCCIKRGVDIRGVDLRVEPVEDIAEAVSNYDAFGLDTIPVVSCCEPSASKVRLGEICAAGGDAAFRSVNKAIDAALSRQVDAIVTAPLHKESLSLAGHKYPGHTEILAERCGVSNFGMALYLGPCQVLASPTGLCVDHVTLHESMRKTVDDVTYDGVLDKIGLVRRFMTIMLGREPRIGVCALNCHAGDGCLFGDEEARIIAPAVEAAKAQGANVAGPFPADTLFLDAKNGLYDGIVAMYHDQGHIAVKMMDMFAAVNVALGLPIVRTSVAHGTAFNIAGQGIAKTQSLVEAVRVAARFALNGETP